ncbi:MAG: c-type cytochrome [Armatimonadetes bacterium]|nr:c-type cytochrome [Armatimonadota bacterium]
MSPERNPRIAFPPAMFLGVLLWASLAARAQDAPALGPGPLLYRNLCASCHHPERLGTTAPPLLPLFLRGRSDAELARVIREGLAATQMPAFPGLSDQDVSALVQHMRSPGEVEWNAESTRASLSPEMKFFPAARPGDLSELTALVERGRSRVWVMEGARVLDRFAFRNVHGGVKFDPAGNFFLIPARDGWIGRYDLGRGYFGSVRACLYLRNIALSRDGKTILAASWLPPGVACLDARTLTLKKWIPVEGRISAVYELHGRDAAVFTFEDRPLLGVLDTQTLAVIYHPLDEPLEDFFIDPLERFVVGTSRAGTRLRAVDLKDFQTRFEHRVDGMPHLFSAAFWYDRGDFYFATPHIGGFITVWKLYDWAFVNRIDLGGKGFFLRTHGETPYLWADRGDDQLVLIDKRDHSLRTLTLSPGKKLLHTEFSGKGEMAYVSVLDRDGALIVVDTATLQERARIGACMPVGKYNFIQKQRCYEPVELGRQVFMEKCWGCHHPTRQAFGPSLRSMAQNRTQAEIWAQILSPQTTHRRLGHPRNAMPRIRLRPEEIVVLVSYIQEVLRASDH